MINIFIEFLKYKEIYFLFYVFFINLHGFFIIAIDKYRAKKKKWRINENYFFITAILGGASGVLLGMTMFRHKTQHKTFYIGIPIIYLLNQITFLAIIYFLYFKY